MFSISLTNDQRWCQQGPGWNSQTYPLTHQQESAEIHLKTETRKYTFITIKTLSSVLMWRRSKLLEQFPQSNNIHFYLSQQIEVWVITLHFSIKIYIFSSSISQSKDVQETVIMIQSLIKPGLRHLLLTQYLFLDLAAIIFASTERWTILFDPVFTRKKKYFLCNFPTSFLV